MYIYIHRSVPLMKGFNRDTIIQNHGYNEIIVIYGNNVFSLYP
jgi:hypothetical protein